MRTQPLDVFLRPRSIAIIGASSDPTRIGGRPLRYLREAGFAGPLFPVNPAHREVQGIPAYPDVESLPDDIDCAMVVVPADKVVASVEACARKGIRGLVIFSAGFAETGEEGAAAQARALAAARQRGTRLLGPNCLGAYSSHDNVYLTFSGVFEDVVGTSGRYGFASQSGGFAGEIVKIAKVAGLDIGTWLTTGNEADVELGEVLLHLADDPNVDVIGAFVEGARSRTTFLAALARARELRKPVVVLKAGRSEAGAHAVRSHTAGIAGADAVYDAVFEAYGVYRARTIEEMLDVMYACRRGVFPAGRRVAIVSNSGGNGALSADVASEAGLDLAGPTLAVRDRIRALTPNAATSNPVDMTAQVANDPTLFSRALDMLLTEGAEEGHYDAAHAFIGLIAGVPFLAEPVATALTGVARRHPDRLLTLSVTTTPDRLAQYEAAGYLVFQDPSRAVRALAAMLYFGRAFSSPGPAACALPALELPEMRGTLGELESKAVLAQLGIPSLPETVVNGAEAGAREAARIEGLLAVKVVSPDIIHKTDVGGVALDIAPHDVARVIEAMRERVSQAEPTARIEGFLLTPMVRDPVQFFLGVHRDPTFGPVVAVGLGGVAVELLGDTACALAPVDHAGALALLRKLRSFPLLDGHRGQPRRDVAALVQAIVAVSGAAARFPDRIRTIEINPLVVRRAGDGLLALDAVVELASPH